MHWLERVALGALLVLPLLPAGASVDPAEHRKAIETVICDCGCHPQSVADCACGRGATMREEILTEMDRDGLDGDALIARYVERFGEQVRIAPSVSGFNLVAWIGPLVLLVAASGGLGLVLRRWRRQQPSETTRPVRLDEADAARLSRELEARDL